MKRDDKKMLQSLVALTERKKVHHQIQSSLNQQERCKIYKVEMKTCGNMQTRKNNSFADGLTLTFRSPCSDDECRSQTMEKEVLETCVPLADLRCLRGRSVLSVVMNGCS